MIPAIAGAFTTAYPEMTLHLSEGSIEEQIDGIRAHDVDVAMFHLEPDNRQIEIGVEQHVIASAPQFVVLPVGHRYARQFEVDMADLSSEGWIAPGMVGSAQSRRNLAGIRTWSKAACQGCSPSATCAAAR